MGKVLTGTASWTDPTLLASGWYPPEADSAEERLRYYAQRFPLVEVDSSYYGLPAEQTAMLWADRTPVEFTFDVKAFRLLTGHPTPKKALPKDIRESLPAGAADKTNVYAKDLPPEVVREVWQRFIRALMPVHSAGKLGAIFLQYPKWFFFGQDSMSRIAEAREHAPDYALAVEFRNPTWLSERNADRTLDFLRDQGIAYTSVDEPQGTAASVPPLAAATSDLAVVRFHGRRAETWDKPNVGVEERFRYLYTESELAEWVPKIEKLQAETREVHVLMNNCYADFGVRNAAQLGQLLLQAEKPVGTA
ncbi:MAG TPA: DUF72 domain-containing protein [Chloroflexota bacterium]|nr:DUF72 domain-containing protein [Chloroflexota bacterium]